MKNMHRLAMIVTKILEIGHWLGALLLFIATWVLTDSAFIEKLSQYSELFTDETEVYGFSVALIDQTGALNPTLLKMFCIGAILIFIMMAIVFRNCYLILKKSANTTPFQKDNIRLLREIGIFVISIPVIGLIMSSIIRLILDVDMVETSTRLDGFIMGILILCLTQFFAHGAELERDIDGLL